MFLVTEADADAIREVFAHEGELFAAIELRRRFPGITGNAKARACGPSRDGRGRRRHRRQRSHPCGEGCAWNDGRVRAPLHLGVFVTTISLGVSYDPAKRDKVLAERGIDFAQAADVFAATVAEIEDTRRDYGERRFVTAGILKDRLVVIVWTPREGSRRIISMRFTHAREEALWRQLNR